MRAARSKDLAQMLRRLADVLADHRGEIDPKQIHLQLGGDDLGGHGLARAGRPAEQRDQAGAARKQTSRLAVLPRT